MKYQRDPHTLLAPPELRRVHPLGKSPVITDGARTIAESGAIIEYLLDTYGDGRLRPPRRQRGALRYTYWLHYAEGSAMPPLLLKLIFQRLPQGTGAGAAAADRAQPSAGARAGKLHRSAAQDPRRLVGERAGAVTRGSRARSSRRRTSR